MDFLAYSQNLHYGDLLSNFLCPDESLDFLNWDPFMAMSPNENVLTDFNPQLWDMEQSWAPFLADRAPKTNKKEEISEEGNHSPGPLVAPSVGSTDSAMKEQQSEILCGEDHSGSNRSSGGEIVESKKRRKRKRNKSTERMPKIAFRTRTDVDVLEDGYKWRKYGKKSIKNNPHLRSYYKCSESNCCVKKKVERDPIDAEVLITTYEGKHNHESPYPTEIFCVVDPTIVQQFSSYRMIVLPNQSLCSSILPARHVLYQ
ncbi:hypothetical protein SUGI_0149100 [Cryptomeria japonica]|uniref:probable WRKY transcription factor 51 n=1 Tax=Cryptomeria japonica TaxID=3369 RepID=UPI002408DCB6|nr:probable WRKY transcription factor 51 [Cryptomeria japonica]GLJ11260.1 hypothetical protein SUGI_0149100 [Cryptomeria japonica]